MSGPTQTLKLQSQKMLASTVQFSTYDQTPVTRPRRTQPAPQDSWWYEMQTGPEEFTVARSLRTQQRAYGPTLTHHMRSMPRGAVLAAADDAGRTGQRSTLEHHPRCVQPVEIDGPS